MTYKIFYKDHQMFDIELYVAYFEKKYYTEIKPYIIAEGLGYYIIENIKTPQELEQLLADVNEVDDLRGLLFEGYWIGKEWENSCLEDCNKADKRMCQIHRPKFEEIMNAFCKKYNLFLITD